MPDLLFAGARMKLQRGRQFIQELEAEEIAYIERKPFTAKMDRSSGTLLPTIHWEAIGEKPSAIAGDAVHNLRTSLDQMASELARRNGESDKDVYFPFATEKKNLSEAIKRKRFFRAGPAAVELLNEFAPYRGGNDPLRGLHELDIQDKHTSLIGVGWTTTLKFQASYNIDHENDDAISVEPEGFHFKFSAWPFEGQAAVETLNQLVELVDGMIEAFAALSTPE